MKNNSNPFSGLSDFSIENGTIKQEDALKVLKAEGPDIMYALSESNRVRHYYFGNRVFLCSILNIKSGGCSEDCAFCAQSARFKTDIETFGLVDYDKIEEYARRAKSWGSHIGFVTSGKNILREDDFNKVLSNIKKISEFCTVDASFGLLTNEQARLLKEAGVRTYNHNIETSSSYFSNIISTHTYRDRVETVKAVTAAGLRACCGGIIGMGESLEDRVSFAFEIHELDVDVIPLNFLYPIDGTPLENIKPIEPMEALKAIALFRLVNPKKDIKICGGREFNLGDLQSMIFFAGASGLLIGDYLTTKGRNVKDDLKMIAELGFTVA